MNRQKRSPREFRSPALGPIEPEELRKNDERKRTVAGIEKKSVTRRDSEHICLFSCLEKFQEAVEGGHCEEHNHRVSTAILRKADMIDHES